MANRSRRIARHGLTILMGLLMVGLFVLVGSSHVARLVGQEVFIIRGGSMEPAIPLGSLVATRPVEPEALAVGDAVSIRLPNGVVVTHRIVGFAEQPDELYLETRGDANKSADPALVPASAVIGVVGLSVPLAGYLLAMLSMPSGIISILSLLGALRLATWMIDDLEAEERAAREAEQVGARQLGEAPA